jgi:hypothetical protein
MAGLAFNAVNLLLIGMLVLRRNMWSDGLRAVTAHG